MTDSVRPAVQVTVGFSTTRLLSSAIIRWLSGGRFFSADTPSHAWIAYDCSTLKTRMVLQAETHGYETIPWARWVKKNILIAEYRIRVDMRRHIPSIAESLGEDYDYAAAFFAGAARLFGKWFRRKLGRVFRSPKKLMCSEAVIKFLDMEEGLHCLGVPKELTLPRELRGRLESLPHDYDRIR